MEDSRQVIAFFDKRRAEVLLMQWVILQKVIDPIKARIPLLQVMIEAEQIDANVKFISKDDTWEEVLYLLIAPFLIQCADKKTAVYLTNRISYQTRIINSNVEHNLTK